MFEEDFVDLSGLVTINIGEMKAAFPTRGDMSLNFVTIDDKKNCTTFSEHFDRVICSGFDLSF